METNTVDVSFWFPAYGPCCIDCTAVYGQALLATNSCNRLSSYRLRKKDLSLVICNRPIIVVSLFFSILSFPPQAKRKVARAPQQLLHSVVVGHSLQGHHAFRPAP